MISMYTLSQWLGIALFSLFCTAAIVIAFAPPAWGQKPANYVQVSGGALDNEVIFATIPLKENWNGRSRGHNDERGKFQLRHSVWRQHSQKPFWWAESALPEHVAETERVVRAHIAWLRAAMCNLGLPETPYQFALMWNAGYHAVASRQISDRQREYARYFENLYRDVR